MRTTPLSAPGDGWRHWPDNPPLHHFPSDRVLELWRENWINDTSFTRQGQMHPATNVFGLWWRPA